MRESRTWRELLKSAIQDPHEKQRIANELNVNQITLLRWANGSSKPRVQYLHQLLNVLPQHRRELTTLIAEEFENIFDTSEGREEEDLQEIPSQFYAHVLAAHATTPRPLRSSLIHRLLLQQALGHLDPYQLGMSITVVRCNPPAPGQLVRSLREDIGRGTPPWNSHLDDQPLLLGAESLAGYAVSSFRFVTNQSIRTGPSFLPVRRTMWEESAAACPLLQGNRVAGCLLVASHQPNYFSSSRLEIIQNYANLLVLAWEPEEFYELSDIQLWMMPAPEVQQVYLAHFQRRVTEVMIKARQNNQPLTRLEAELEVWHQLEDEFIQESLRSPSDAER